MVLELKGNACKHGTANAAELGMALPKFPDDQIIQSAAVYVDFVTKQPISHERCKWICQQLDEYTNIMYTSKQYYEKVKFECKGTEDEKRYAAKKASRVMQGGGLTYLWDRLHRQKIAITLMIIGPPLPRACAK